MKKKAKVITLRSDPYWLDETLDVVDIKLQFLDKEIEELIDKGFKPLGTIQSVKVILEGKDEKRGWRNDIAVMYYITMIKKTKKQGE